MTSVRSVVHPGWLEVAGDGVQAIVAAGDRHAATLAAAAAQGLLPLLEALTAHGISQAPDFVVVGFGSAGGVRVLVRGRGVVRLADGSTVGSRGRMPWADVDLDLLAAAEEVVLEAPAPPASRGWRRPARLSRAISVAAEQDDSDLLVDGDPDAGPDPDPDPDPDAGPGPATADEPSRERPQIDQSVDAGTPRPDDERADPTQAPPANAGAAMLPPTAPMPVVAPPPPAPPATDPPPPQPDPPADDDHDRPVVLAVLCPAGHPSPPQAGRCRTCDREIPPQQPIRTPRPPLGVLRVSTGGVVPLDRGVLLGRAPRVNEDLPADRRPHLLRVGGGGRDISRNHAEVVLEGWDVLVRDLGSANGTTVTLPGREPVRLRPTEDQGIEPGAVITLAHEISLTFEVQE